jgi:hypothetical protein
MRNAWKLKKKIRLFPELPEPRIAELAKHCAVSLKQTECLLAKTT